LARDLLTVAGVEILGTEQRIMQAALEVRSVRSELLAENVANADTPGYISRDLRFDDALGSVLEGAQPNAQGLSDSEAVAQNVRADGNNEDVNQQLAKVSENALKYAATLKLYSDSTGRLKTASSGS
jgi:flagellar basal-body rod protein FlgB